MIICHDKCHIHTIASPLGSLCGDIGLCRYTPKLKKNHFLYFIINIVNLTFLLIVIIVN